MPWAKMRVMKLAELLHYYSRHLADESRDAAARTTDTPIATPRGRQVSAVGTLFLYALDLPTGAPLPEDLPVSIVPGDQAGDLDPTEGVVIGREGDAALIQTYESLGHNVGPSTIVPDAAGFFQTASQRLADMADHADRFTLGPAERLIPWLHPDESVRNRTAPESAAFTTFWSDDLAARRNKLVTLAVTLARNNKRLLVISPDHRRSDEITGQIARALKHAPLPYKSLVTRYEMPVEKTASGITLGELGFEAQMHQFYAKSRADKATLRRKYERFRELTPLLAYKAEKQRDLNEVRLLEWRLITQTTDLQNKIKENTETLATYDSLPLMKRLAMQALGKNTTSLVEYNNIFEQQITDLKSELDTAQRRIAELTPEAAIPKDLKPEYKDLRDEVKRLGGTKKIRELLAAEEGTNRQAFLQNKRLVATTAARVASDPLFAKVRFDVLIADEAPWIPATYLLASAGLVRERIVMGGDTRDIQTAKAWESTGAASAKR
jgi:AAA domain-containing protein